MSLQELRWKFGEQADGFCLQSIWFVFIAIHKILIKVNINGRNFEQMLSANESE